MYKWPTSSANKMTLRPEQAEWSGSSFWPKCFFAVEFVRCVAIAMHLCLNMQLTLGT